MEQVIASGGEGLGGVEGGGIGFRAWYGVLVGIGQKYW